MEGAGLTLDPLSVFIISQCGCNNYPHDRAGRLRAMHDGDLSPAALAEVRAVLADLMENRDLAARTAEARGVPELLALHDDTIMAGWRVLAEPTVGNLLSFAACLDEEEAIVAER